MMSLEQKEMDRMSSLRNALRLLNLFSMDEPELSVSQLAKKLEVGLSTAHRLASTLVSEGFMIKDPLTKLYRPGASILAMGNIVLSSMEICRISTPSLESLIEKTGETVHIGILKDDHIMYLNKIDGHHPVHLLSHSGKRNPVYCTSSGQVILAYQPQEVIDKIIVKGLKPYTNKTITSPEQFYKIMEKIRNQGYAVSLEEFHEGVNSIAAPVRNPAGKVIASVNIAGPTQRINPHTIPRLVKLLIETANDISVQLKHIKISGSNLKP